MIDLRILKQYGSDAAAIRDFFTADPTSPQGAKRVQFEKILESRIHEGTLFGLRNYQFYAASDLAWDSNIITKELIPLQLYAQGKITVQALADTLSSISPESREKFVEKDKAGTVTGIKVPEFHKVVVNLVRSFITRRTAALATKYTNLFPFFRYESLSTSFVAKLRAEVLSQRIEMMTNAYGYRHDLVQCIRDMLLYGHVCEFVASSWDHETSLRAKQTPEGIAPVGEDGKIPEESYVVREGVLYARPHPSRSFWDMSYPTSSINTDTGCTFGGYWNIVRYGDVWKNPAYFNRDKIAYDSAFHSQLAAYKGYWELYFSNAPVKFPGLGLSTDLPGANDRQKNVGVYNGEQVDQSLLLHEYRQKVIPKEIGIGEYPHPVWMRLVVAGGRTVVYGEFLPSTPATIWSYNENDGRLLNNAWAHDIMPWTDMMTNGLTNLLLSQRAALIKLILMDVDQVNDPDVVKAIREIVKGDGIFNRPQLIEYKGAQYDQMGVKPRDAIQVSETQPVNDITLYYKSLMQLLALAERVLGMSANESAQSEQREISATENANIANVVNTTLAFMGLGVDEAVDAKKKQLYESLIACSSTRIQVPVVNRFQKATIEAAGFRLLEESEDGSDMSMYRNSRVTILGTKEALIYDYNFSSRDGSERASNSKAAEVMVNLLAQLVNMPGFVQALGKERLFLFLNEVVRLSGAGVDLRFDLRDGETVAMPTGDPVSDNKAAVEQAISQIINAIEGDRKRIDSLEQLVRSVVGSMPSGIPGSAPQVAA